MAPPHPLALFHFQPPRPTFFDVDPTPPLYNTNSVACLCHWLTGRVSGLNTNHVHPTPPFARSSGFSLCLCNICASMQDLPQILDHGFGQTFLAYHQIFYSYWLEWGWGMSLRARETTARGVYGWCSSCKIGIQVLGEYSVTSHISSAQCIV
jgi:hypothetical protein